MTIPLIASIFSGSLWQIISNTSFFGLIILIVLLFMSVFSWVIIAYKWRHFNQVEHDNTKFIQQFRRARQLNESLGQAKNSQSAPVSQIFLTGYNELLDIKERKGKGVPDPNRSVRFTDEEYEIVEMAMEKTLTEQVSFIEKKVIFLASTANSAPFIGLLGTVVGIMDAFWAIGERGSASLAVVAPGIAEALLATIVGLAAAIPAVIAFNWANNRIKQINDTSFNFILEFIGQVKKEQIG